MPKVVLAVLGILAIIIILLAVILIADFRFNQSVKREVEDLFKDNFTGKAEIVRETDLSGLPPVARKWLEQSGVVGRERIRAVRLKQNAQLRLKEERDWMPARVEQYFTVDKPGFIWKARVNMAPLVYFTGRDRYAEGRGHMLIKLFSLVKVADAGGKEIDQGTLLRYLAETVWFPAAALSPYLHWEEAGPNSAKVTMDYGGVSATGVFTFNEQGEVVSFVAERYGEFNGRYLLRPWSVLIKEHREFNGVRIPSRGDVVWKLDTGDFHWYQFEITEIEYNRPEAY
ncbi:MAG TPA: hypothetical protein PL078_02045 [Bacillota bacterium]|jgi:hypothetical protein|nr:hypothetical protein [Peptococcaceae bacterium MAG4]NLW37694.1 hypothetical protein [Peptococcaceae bacterium]HPZ42761.1 hypothetical protein [Bacillota bacterium]HQD75448.1 hypothetical protein [Bacillota bacterium]HUM59114.1 hypothetical protein [Bacillota bacterium]